ncbi:MAG TPA: propanediol utilization protein, partial [Flavobacterium sp.]|nr:propanediol utilization protein [Flavobacterium sp.]
MKRTLQSFFIAVFAFGASYSQQKEIWQPVQKGQVAKIAKNTERELFPKDFKLFKAELSSLRQQLFVANSKGSRSVLISIPNADGGIEQFKVYEASNFTSELQAQFPEIRAYKGDGVDDPYAQIRLSIDASGIQAMIFRTAKKNEFIEPYSADGTVYAVFNSSRQKGNLPFVCATAEQVLTQNLASRTASQSLSTSTELLTFKLALSCNAEYANYFGATNASQVSLVLAGFNATMTRVNGVFEKDFAIHMNIIA